jgi:uncharacterized protein (TIGR00730 family)
MQSICVFCGSKTGTNGCYRKAAAELGQLLASRGCTLVYGGGSVGLMGVIANAVLASGGKVVGVIPKVLATEELIHPGVDQMHIVGSMHARKAQMNELSDAFVALPGGYGTFEELFEVVTWAQLGLHRKPIGLLNAAGYFDPLVTLIDHAVREGFIKPAHRQLLLFEPSPEKLLDRMDRYTPPVTRRRIEPDEA